MKKTCLFLLMIMLLLTASACNREDSPEAAVEKLISAASTFDTKKMERAVSPKVQIGMAAEDFWQQEDMAVYENAFERYLRDNNRKLEYRVVDNHRDGDRAFVTIDFRFVDGSQVVTETMVRFIGETFHAAFSGEVWSEADAEALLGRIMADVQEEKDTVFTRQKVVFPCIFLDGVWYVDEISEDFMNVILSNLLQLDDTLNGILGI